MSIIKSPQVFIDTCKKMWHSNTQILSHLLIAKKIIARYGLLVSKIEIIDSIYQWDPDTATILSIFFQLWYKTNDEIDYLTKRVQQILQNNYCTVEIQNQNDWNETITTITNAIEKVKTTDILIEKELNSVWLHVYTDTHRYHRDIDTDLNIILR